MPRIRKPKALLIPGAFAFAVAIAAGDARAGDDPAARGWQFEVHGMVQGDQRDRLDAGARDRFLWRRAEPTLAGRRGDRFAFKLTAQLAGERPSLLEGYADLKLGGGATLRIGKAKSPFGMERLQSSAATQDIELGLPSELAPGRDHGMQLMGSFATRGEYAIGVFAGAPDGRDGASRDPDGQPEVVARLLLAPGAADGPLSGLGIGVAVSGGNARGSGDNVLPRYRTPGQETFFAYRAGVVADGARFRISPQARFFHGPVGVLAEYVASRQALSFQGQRERLEHRAWQVAGRWVLTGEAASDRNPIRPDRPWSGRGGGWGAIELVARHGRLSVDPDAFPLFADPARRSAIATESRVGANWYPDGHVKLAIDYAETTFSARPGAARAPERIVSLRAQFSF